MKLKTRETIGNLLAPGIPDDFLDVLEPFRLGLDRRLGYTQDAPWASFWLEEDAKAIAWSDGSGRGSDAASLKPFLAEVIPVAITYGLRLDPGAGQHALMLDRERGFAYFAPLPCALSFVMMQSAAARDEAAPPPNPTWNGYRKNTLIGTARTIRGDV